MSEDRHPVDDLLRALAGDPKVDPADLTLIESRVDAAIQEEKIARQRQEPRKRAVGWAAAIMAVVVGMSVVLQTARVSPAVATLEAIARAAEAADPLTITDTEFLYTRSETQARTVVPKTVWGILPTTGTPSCICCRAHERPGSEATVRSRSERPFTTSRFSPTKT